jgi:BMFP domain-containing protein YqiC
MLCTNIEPRRFCDAAGRIARKFVSFFAIRGRASEFCSGKFTTDTESMESMMADAKLLDELSARIKEMMADSPARDIEKNVRAMLTAAFARFDLVTRQEFDIQSAVLARTREKLAQLEAKLAELEKRNKSEVGGGE